MPLQNFGIVARSKEMPRPGGPECGDRDCTSLACCTIDTGVILRAAQPDAATLNDLEYAFGTFAACRLSAPGEGPMSQDAETAALTAISCRAIHDPRLGNGMKPDANTLKNIANDVNAIYESGENVLVHCLHGRERTGAVCAAWRLIFEGASLADVEADLRAYGVTGLAAVVDHEIVEAVRELARGIGK